MVLQLQVIGYFSSKFKTNAWYTPISTKKLLYTIAIIDIVYCQVQKTQPLGQMYAFSL